MSFFESMTLSGQERIHSQVIAWIFSSECNSLPLNEKVRLLSAIVNKDIVTNSIRSITEYGNIDILIVCDKDAIVIENKVKIQTHSNQLEKYQQIALSSELTKNLNHHFIYLALFPENIENDLWIKLLHRDLFKLLSESNKNEYNDSILLGEYLKFHQKLVIAQDEFFKNPKAFGEVNKYASLKKIDKANVTYSSPVREFISKAQLETIFQIAYLKFSEVAHGKFTIEESHGMALINFHLMDYEHDGVKYCTNLQSQGDTLKMNFSASNYTLSKKDNLPETVFNFFKNDNATIYWSKYSKFNSPKTKAYLSRSKKIGFPYEYERAELAEMLRNEIRFF